MQVVLPNPDRMYRALAESDPAFDGVFYVAVKTTKIFCRPTCPARTPKPENVEFFANARDALYAGFRPCKRCHPMDRIQKAPPWVKQAIELLEADPTRRVKEFELRQVGIEPERLRRYFKKHYGMTFQTYARGRRLGSALNKLREGQDVIEAAMDHGFESTSGFREAFEKAFGSAPSDANSAKAMLMRWIETPLGPMIAVASDQALCLLEFVDRRMLQTQVETLRMRFGCPLVPGKNVVLDLVEKELGLYFDGRIDKFKTPIEYPGTEFQTKVWNRLLQIPYGQTLSYGQMARDLGTPDAQRAVGKANGDNRIAIIIPCHRVIRSDGKLCGYGGGIWRKQRLLELESGQLGLL